MRKLSGFVVVLALILGGGFLAWPDQVTAQWGALRTIVERQVRTELATLDQLLSGKMQIGATTDQAAPAPAPSRPQTEHKPEPAIALPARQLKTQKKTSRVKAATPLPASVAPTHEVPGPRAITASPAATADSTPEAALGAILKHEIRENQAKEETFWTPERIQEALDNGAPKSKGAPCIAFCDKNNADIEINMPKTPQ